MSYPFWWTTDVEDETSRPEDEYEQPELADEEADRVERDLTKEW